MIYEFKPMTSQEPEKKKNREIMRKITCFIGVDAIDLLDVIYSPRSRSRIASLGGEKRFAYRCPESVCVRRSPKPNRIHKGSESLSMKLETQANPFIVFR